jgi:hypothetical protein
MTADRPNSPGWHGDTDEFGRGSGALCSLRSLNELTNEDHSLLISDQSHDRRSLVINYVLVCMARPQ